MRTILRRFFISRLLCALIALAVVAPAQAAAPQPPAAGGFTLAVLPDTQMYAWKDPSLYTAQTKWIADNVKLHNIQMVLHLGDVTQHNTNDQWRAARSAPACIFQSDTGAGPRRHTPAEGRSGKWIEDHRLYPIP